ncbi:MAG: HlyC/CorC family transporter [Enterocloster asparagiformis]|nr:HlyC/CorC family transporter [Enterocloster asparagiformis]
MDDGYSPVGILVLIGLILLEAVFYGFGSAIQNVNEGKLEEEMENGNQKAARLLRIVNRPTRFVNTIQITTHLAGIITGIIVLPMMVSAAAARFKTMSLMSESRAMDLAKGLPAPAWYADPLWWMWTGLMVLFAVVVVALIVSFGIIIPKRLAAKEPEKWGYRVMPAVLFVAALLLPLTKLISGIAWLVLKAFGVDMMADDENVTEEDIMSMVNEGHEQGVLEAGETEMITNIFQLGDKEAWDIMTHRTNMVVLAADTTLKEAVDFILKEGTNTRYPVYGEDIDDIVGILHLRDAMAYFEKPENKDRQLTEIPGLLREASFIPETRSIDTLFKEMQSNKIHMEIVVDEYGQTAGLLTMEDILEEIVGNIMDEYDEEEEFITPQEDGSFLMSGMTPLEDVMDALGIRFSDEDSDTYDTLNGFLISRLDRIPQEHERPLVEFAGYRFQVVKVGNKMIESVHVSRICEPESGEGEVGKEMKDSDDADRTEHKGDVPG